MTLVERMGICIYMYLYCLIMCFYVMTLWKTGNLVGDFRAVFPTCCDELGVCELSYNIDKVHNFDFVMFISCSRDIID